MAEKVNEEAISYGIVREKNFSFQYSFEKIMPGRRLIFTKSGPVESGGIRKDPMSLCGKSGLTDCSAK